MKTGIKGTIAIASALFIAGVAHQASADFGAFVPRGQLATCIDVSGPNNNIVTTGHACIGTSSLCRLGANQVAAFCNGNDCQGKTAHGVGCPGQFYDSSQCIDAMSTGTTAIGEGPTVMNFSGCEILVPFD